MNETLKAYKEELQELIGRGEKYIEPPTKEMMGLMFDEIIKIIKKSNEMFSEVLFPVDYGNHIDGGYDNTIQFCSMYYSPRIHVYSGIEQLAEMFGAELQRADRKDKDFPVELSFNYNGYKVFQIGNTDDEDKVKIKDYKG